VSRVSPLCLLFYSYHISDTGGGLTYDAGWELYNRPGGPDHRADRKRSHRFEGIHDKALSVQKEYIDGEPHPKGMHASARIENKSFSGLGLPLAHPPAQAGPESSGVGSLVRQHPVSRLVNYQQRLGTSLEHLTDFE